MAPGVGGAVFTVISCVEDPEVPQTLDACTAMDPLEALAVAEIELVVDVPDHPEGKFQM